MDLRPSSCAVCGTTGNATELYPATFNATSFNPVAFSARRLPDRIHYRVVRCNACGLVRSDPVADAAALAGLYARSTFEYGEEVRNLQRTYARYLRLLARYGRARGALLEIGCGPGFFLEEARRQGYREVWGVEPSRAVVELAAPAIRPRIVCDVLRPGQFEPARFDVVCAFQVLDHVPDPQQLLDECHRLLGPGGLFLAITHDQRALSARLLGARSPIVDLEHTYLYNRATVARLLERSGFEVCATGAVVNVYSLRYVAWLLPLPRAVKTPLLRALGRTPLGRVAVPLRLGNLYAIGREG